LKNKNMKNELDYKIIKRTEFKKNKTKIYYEIKKKKWHGWKYIIDSDDIYIVLVSGFITFIALRIFILAYTHVILSMINLYYSLCIFYGFTYFFKKSSIKEFSTENSAMEYIQNDIKKYNSKHLTEEITVSYKEGNITIEK